MNGLVEQSVHTHLRGFLPRNKSNQYHEKFIENAIRKFGDRFDYSKTEYTNRRNKVKIICEEHGEFEILPLNFLKNKYGCTKCGIRRGKDIKEKKRINDSIKRYEKRKKSFFEKCYETHGDKFDYSKTEYINNKIKVKIICKKHGEFSQRASAHLDGQGCLECRLDNRRTGLNIFLQRCKNIHGEKYDYSLVSEYKNSKEKIKVICKEHGIFEISPEHHTNRKHGCGECKKLGLFKFIEKSNHTHNNKYDYSLIKEYVNNKSKVKIICKEHGVFEQRVGDHLTGIGCPECSIERFRLSTQDFIKKANIIHKNKYSYSNNIQFKSNKDKIEIECKEHGIFKQRINSHLNGQGCPSCKKIGISLFIKKCRDIHNNKYRYDKTLLNSVSEKVIITCDKHGDFEQRASAHLDGNGCPSCKVSKGELEISKILNKNNIEYKIQYKFRGCKNIKELPFDFYLPNYNLCIEYNGEQHYRVINHFGGVDKFKKQLINDKIKKDYCENNNIELLIIRYDENVESILVELLKRKETL